MQRIALAATGVLTVAAAVAYAATAPGPQPVQSAPTVLITGSNRGIGLAFARHYAEAGWTVIATARRPETATELNALAASHTNVTVAALDVTDRDGIQELATRYRDHTIDVLINNAGVLGEPAAQTLDGLDYEDFAQVMAVNVFGPLDVARAFVDHVAASDQRKIVTVSSISGSLTATRGGRGGFYFYRISKAAVNMAMRTLQLDVQDRGVIVAMLMPGAVATRMLAQTGYRGPAIEPEESVAGMTAVIAGLTAENAGAFLNYDGESLPW